MQRIIARFQAYKCQLHHQQFTYWCIEQDCRHMHRGLCLKCITTGIQAFRISDLQELHNLAQMNECQLDDSMQQFIQQMGITYLNKKITINNFEEVGNSLSGILSNSSIDTEIQKSLLFEEMDSKANQFKNHQLKMTKKTRNKCEQIKVKLLKKQGEVIMDYYNQVKEQYDLFQKQYMSYDLQQNWQTRKTILLKQEILHLEYNHNSTELAVSGMDRIVIFRTSISQNIFKFYQIIRKPYKFTELIKYNNNSTILASCGRDNMITLLVYRNGAWVNDTILQGHSKAINTLCFSNDSILLCSSSIQQICIHAYVNNNWILLNNAYLTLLLCQIQPRFYNIGLRKQQRQYYYLELGQQSEMVHILETSTK